MPHDLSGPLQPVSTGLDSARDMNAIPARASRVLVIDADPALFGLIEEWLGAVGHSAVLGQDGNGHASDRFDLVVIDIPFPRSSGLAPLKRVAGQHPDTPILALSSTFFPGIESNGAVARSLGVAGVLPKPLKRDALIAAVGSLLHPSGRAKTP